MDRNGVIGSGGALPWHLPADLKHFRTLTMGKPIIMGRRTHESIGRPLPGRENVVLTRDPDYRAPGCTVLHSVEAVLARFADAAEIVVAGGADIYRALLPHAARIYLTRVHTEAAGDTHFPDYDPGAWDEIERQEFPADEKNRFACSFSVLERRN
jgi:dihydrofolate reductase